ncbi:MAG: metallophosphoesterase [Rhodoferax sp.]|nr:metallophosphoesterase [Rhodoferax sp.]
MSVLLQISDPHFGTEQPLVVEALVAFAKQQRPNLLVLSGDITQRARPEQFRAAYDCMSRMGASMLAVPGNHDIPLFDVWTRLRRPYAQHVAAFGADLEQMHASPDLIVVGVNTTRPWRHKHGEVSAQQIERVEGILASADSKQLRVVVVHQPLAVTRPQDVPNLMRGRAAALRRWAAAGADIVMGGHIHLPYVLAMPGLARPLWVVQAGTAVSSRVRPGVPNSVNLLRWGAASEAGCCRVEQWDFSDANQTFVCCKVTDIRPIRND